VIEDGAIHRESEVTGEALHCSVRGSRSTGREAQEETQGRTKQCKVADESVVAMKFRPMRAGNRLEEKTGMTCNEIAGGDVSQKPHCLRREEVYSNVSGMRLGCAVGHKLPDGVGHFAGGRL
jgi:hypothetical protein